MAKLWLQGLESWSLGFEVEACGVYGIYGLGVRGFTLSGQSASGYRDEDLNFGAGKLRCIPII